MIAMTIAEIAAAVDGRVVGAADAAARVIDGLSYTDSREMVEGGVFFAKPGEFTDGHLFAPQAVERGAALLVVDHELELDVPQIVVADVVEALGALARHVIDRARSAGILRIVGITGSNGKTTTKNLLAAILHPLAETVAARASFNNEVGAPLTMLEVTQTTRFLVSEMGASREGDIARLIHLAKPDVGVVLKVGLAHAGEFGGIEATQRAKSEMVTDLDAGDTAVLNADDPRVAAMAPLTDADVLWFGHDGVAAPDRVRATEVRASRAGTTFTLHLPNGDSREVVFRVLGEHHVSNALAAAASAFALGVGIDDIVAGLQSVTRAERWRMEVMGGVGGVTVINDAYNASPDSMAAALKTLVQLREPSGRAIAVLGEMSELGEASGPEHDRIGLLAVRLGIDQVVVVGAGARRMHISTINEGSWDGESVFVESQDEAFDLLKSLLKEGDTVLVKSSNSAGLRHLGDRLGELFS
ncbi:UDP-N-acetylmuramoyl-tripeptide--D-alanyl-D-alanine ligase [Humibacter sp. RRB41]|uniref:UDP-N-acetylmuramoyl-tripeptide--D-alanyl-D- alanine ligase n=1 Tax=Humibacter sp. RRB41 TaxID=2919946 RepID=UPI001FAAEC21|nr:UDP-N-acetylmuramoyl-tripeptide--D-alanyl-D-alanine ligase [Humibacter sp. RRB41]